MRAYTFNVVSLFEYGIFRKATGDPIASAVASTATCGYFGGKDGSAQFTQLSGILPEGLNIVENKRMWQITRSFKVDSVSLPILIQDNLNNVEDTLVVRDLNTGISDTFTDCVILNISGEQDSGTRTVTWNALYRNGR